MNAHFNHAALENARTAAAPMNAFERSARQAPRSATESAAALARLRDALDFAFAATPGGAEFARRMRAALAEAAAEDTLLTPAQREGSASRYQRHLVIADPQGRYAAAALVWLPGQASPVHGHQTWCGYAVLDGQLEETLYAWDDAAGCAVVSRTHAREAGAVSYVGAGLGGIHRLGNVGTRPAVSLHVYGVAGEHIASHVNRFIPVGNETALNGR